MTDEFTPLRFHDYRETGVGCGLGCVRLVTATQLKRRAYKYGLVPADLAELIAVTNGLCMLCQRCHANMIEHCHGTNRVRGLVCTRCNHRLAILEGRTSRYPRGYLCSCVEMTALDARAQASAQLEAATYRFIDHAIDLEGPTTRASFRLLVDHPYPDQHLPQLAPRMPTAAGSQPPVSVGGPETITA